MLRMVMMALLSLLVVHKLMVMMSRKWLLWLLWMLLMRWRKRGRHCAHHTNLKMWAYRKLELRKTEYIKKKD